MFTTPLPPTQSSGVKLVHLSTWWILHKLTQTHTLIHTVILLLLLLFYVIYYDINVNDVCSISISLLSAGASFTLVGTLSSISNHLLLYNYLTLIIVPTLFFDDIRIKTIYSSWKRQICLRCRPQYCLCSMRVY